MYVQKFSAGSAADKDLLGGKGANLAEMRNLGLPVPDGVTITTKAWEAWNLSSAAGKCDIIEELAGDALKLLEEMFPGGLPLLSVRSGARVSMPGMMDTILNVGINSYFPEWEEKLGRRVALDCKRRFLSMYGETALGIDGEKFSEALAKIKSYKYGMDDLPVADADMSEAHLEKLCERYLSIIKGYKPSFGLVGPDGLRAALETSIEAVFASWNSERAKAYRAAHGYPDDWGTAVNIQQMVFGNLNDKSCSGVLFSRDPSTGEDKVIGEFLPNAQGEDVVAGIRTPLPLSAMVDWNADIHEELAGAYGLAKKMENHYGDMQDLEFTVEDGKLYILQTRAGKRSAEAAFRVSHDLWMEERIDINMALSRVTMNQYLKLSAPRIELVTGKAVFSKEAAISCTVPCILIREETTPDDFPGMDAAVGVLTATGGATSHAAVVARGMDKACVTGCTELRIDSEAGWAKAGEIGEVINEGEDITIDGATGRVWVKTHVPVIEGKVPEYVEVLMAHAREKVDNFLLPVTCPEEVPAQYGGVFIDANEVELATALDILKVCDVRNLPVIVSFHKRKTETDIEFERLLNLNYGEGSGFSPHALREYLVPGAVNWEMHLTAQASPELRKDLKESGWELVETIRSWDALLDPEVHGSLDGEWVLHLIEDGIPVDTLKERMKALGKSFDTKAKPSAPEARQLFDVLGVA
jgi:pyruvate,orthophosphate dikinase